MINRKYLSLQITGKISRKSDIMLKPLRCEFLTGALTDTNSMEVLREVFEEQRASIHEILYYKKNGTGIWLEVGCTEIRTQCHTNICLNPNQHNAFS